VNVLTTDTFFNGRIRVKQYRAGYRFSIDAVLLACFVKPRSGERIVDLGAGCGIIPLILSFHHPDIKVCGIEVQKELADLAVVNVRENQMEHQIKILCEDMKRVRDFMISGPADIVVSNPPFRKSNSGRINPNRQRAEARHEIRTTLSDVVQTACRLLRSFGRFVMIYSAERMTDVVAQMRSGGIEPKMLRTVHSHAHSEATLVLFDGIKGGRPGVKISAPLVIYQENGNYTEEVQKMFLPENESG
jgi:tRNA1Val (adenine37-N6)-methyltransferase